MDEGVEGLLHLRGAGIQLIQKKDIGLAPGNGPGRAEPAEAVLNLGDADDIFRSQLAAQQRNAFQPQRTGELLNNGRFADARRAPYEHGPDEAHVQQNVQQLFLIDGHG